MDRGIPKSRPGCVSEVELDVANKEKIAAVGVGSGSRTRNRVGRILKQQGTEYNRIDKVEKMISGKGNKE